MKTAHITTLAVSCFFYLASAATHRTKVAILGGGVSGISAALKLTEEGIHDFIMIEARHELGGRAQNAPFGNTHVELGCNWVQGLGTNPINELAKKYKLNTASTNGDDVVFYGEKGKIDGEAKYKKFNGYYEKMTGNVLKRIKRNLADLSGRAALDLAGWTPKTFLDDAIEYYVWDWEMGETPELSSSMFTVLNDNWTYTGFGPGSDGDNMVLDNRGFKYVFQQEAKKAFKAKQSRLMLNSIITKIEYNKEGVTVYTKAGDVVHADYAISTFSVGVMQHKDIEWSPQLPEWKMEGIYAFHMATYTKIFMNFPYKFWDDNEFVVWADPDRRGYFNTWQNLNAKGYLPQNTSTNIFFATVTQDMSYEIERMTDEEVKQAALKVLRRMYGDHVPEPTDILFPRWHSNPLFRGSYSNWPIGELSQHHINMRAPLHNRLFFAGEALSAKYYGFLQGAWFTGIEAAESISQCMKSKCPIAHYFPEITNPVIYPNTIAKRDIIV
ncbi:hypothetical protein RMATCC62417_11056 [Rhizopus microsporus]|nr:hypothetical protein RMATCC62417_11056 [Rhizopus microsporus]